MILTFFPQGDVNQYLDPQYELLIRKALEGKTAPSTRVLVDAQGNALPGEQYFITEVAQFRVQISDVETQTTFLQAGQTIYFPLNPDRTIH